MSRLLPAGPIIMPNGIPGANTQVHDVVRATAEARHKHPTVEYDDLARQARADGKPTR
jgi:hypothetical protein